VFRKTYRIYLIFKKSTASMSGSTVAAYGRAKTLDQQDLGHYTTKSIIMPNPLIFKCEWESIEQKKDKKKKEKSNEKEKNVRKKREKPVRASRLWVQLCVHIVRKFNNITVLKVLVLSLYNSVLNTCARKRRRYDVPAKTRKRMKTCVCNSPSCVTWSVSRICRQYRI